MEITSRFGSGRHRCHGGAVGCAAMQSAIEYEYEHAAEVPPRLPRPSQTSSIAMTLQRWPSPYIGYHPKGIPSDSDPFE